MLRSSFSYFPVELAIRQAVANPIGTAPLIEVVKPGDKVVIVVSDVTRLWVQADVFLPVLLDVLNGAGVPDKDISIVTSTGDHRLQTIAEHAAICGDKVLARVPIYDHECHATDLVDLGKSSQGTPIKVNRRVWEADKVILTGGIAYHMLECSDGIGSEQFHEFFKHGEVEDMNAKLHADFVMSGDLHTKPFFLS